MAWKDVWKRWGRAAVKGRGPVVFRGVFPTQGGGSDPGDEADPSRRPRPLPPSGGGAIGTGWLLEGQENKKRPKTTPMYI